MILGISLLVTTTPGSAQEATRRDPVLTHLGVQTALVGASLWLWDLQRPAAERRSWRRWMGQSLAGGALLGAGQGLVARGPRHGGVAAGMLLQGTGTSIIRNWGEQRGTFRRMRLPLYPLVLEWDQARGAWPRAQLSVGATAALVTELALSPPSERRIDWGTSVQTLGLVLEGSREGLTQTVRGTTRTVEGYQWFGLVRVARDGPVPQHVLRHELLHRQQHWRDRELFGAPISAPLRRQIPARWRGPSWVSWDVLPVLEAAHQLTLRHGYATSWYEREVASWLPRR